MKSAHDIVAIYTQRKTAHSGAKARRRNLRDHYNGDIVVPLPELDTTESAAVANLVAQGLDQIALRIASVTPDIVCPPDGATDRARRNADVRRRGLFAWWQNSAMDLQLEKRARHYIGYAETIAQVRWDAKTDAPIYEWRDPLTSYPSNLRGVDDMRPADCVFGYERSLDWVKNRYPEAALRFANAGRNQPVTHDRQITMIEWVDADERVLIGLKTPWGVTAPDSGDSVMIELERIPNLLGECGVVVSQRTSLDEAQGQFDGMLGMYQQQAKLMALEVLAVQKGIFPDTWLVGNAGEQPKIVSMANGLTGEIGVVRGGSLQDMQLQPGFMTTSAIDRLERAQRLDAGIDASFGGESASNIRTARRGQEVLRETISYSIQSAQRHLARSLEHENRLAVKTALTYGPARTRTFYIRSGPVKGPVEYTPNKHFETADNAVVYANPGTDVNSLAIAGGQRVQMGTMSKRSFMETDPMIQDVESEHDTVVAEQLEDALLAGLQQQAATGAIPPSDVARIMKLVGSDKADLADAVDRVQREAQERQAAQVPLSSPEAQPGIAQPGAGAESAMAAMMGAAAQQGPEEGMRAMLEGAFGAAER